MPKKLQLTGLVFGKLTVIEEAKSHNGKSKWLCRCECGNFSTVTGALLKKGETRSCGCLTRQIKHGKTETRAYKIWKGMKYRCINPNVSKYECYGGRGIAVCDRWMNSFENFLLDMGEPPDSYTLDRIDVNGNYCPENCRWASRKEQANNRRTCIYITWGGKTQTATQWAEETGLSGDCVRDRWEKGVPLERIFEPMRDRSITPPDRAECASPRATAEIAEATSKQ